MTEPIHKCECDLVFDTPEAVETWIRRNPGDAPGSQYGTKPSAWVPVAVAAVETMAEAQGEEPTPEGIDHMVSLVVNGHDDIAYLLVSYGHEAGYQPEDYLDNAQIEAVRERMREELI